MRAARVETFSPLAGGGAPDGAAHVSGVPARRTSATWRPGSGAGPRRSPMDIMLEALQAALLLLLLAAGWQDRRRRRQLELEPLAEARPEASPAEPPPPARLTVNLDGGLELGDVLVSDGDLVEILLPAGRWLPAQLRREPEGWPGVWVTLGGPWEHATNGRSQRRPYLAARVSTDALMRRPSPPEARP